MPKAAASGSPRGIVWCLAVAALLVFAVHPATGGQEKVVDGVPHVSNAAPADTKPQVVHLEELWRAGGADDEETFFGVVTQALSGADGTVYLLDSQLSQVHVFSPDGEPMEPLSREGEGPGEVRQPADMVLLSDGALGLVQTFPGKIVKIGTDGTPAGEVTVGSGDPTQGGFSVLLDAKERGGNLVLAGIQLTNSQGTQERTSYLASFTPQGEEKTRYLEKQTTFEFSNFQIIEKDQYFVYPRRWDIGKDGSVVAAPERDAYVLHVYAPDGKLQRVIERDFKPRPRDESERTIIESAIEAQTRQVPFEVKTEIADTEPVIQNVRVAPNGEIWVSHHSSNRDLPEGVLHAYDVFDSKGNWLRPVHVAAEGDPEQDGLIFLSADRAVIIRGLVDAALTMQGATSGEEDSGEAQPIEVICYRVKK